MDWDIIEVKKAMIRSAQKTISLSISEKLNTIQKLQVCKLEEVDILITELNASHQLLAEYLVKGIQIL